MKEYKEYIESGRWLHPRTSKGFSKKGQRFEFDQSPRIKFDTFIRYIFASNYVANKKVLDAACGIGFGTFLYAQEASEVWGIDSSKEAIEYALKNFNRHNVFFEIGDLLQIPLASKHFDVIISFHIIEQLYNPQLFLERLHRFLKDDGIIILSTPNKKIVSPFTKEPIGKFNKFEFYKRDLEMLFKGGFKAKWYGQRNTFFLFANRIVRRFVRLLEIILRKEFGLYGSRESYEIKPLRWWRVPKDFVIILKKI